LLSKAPGKIGHRSKVGQIEVFVRDPCIRELTANGLQSEEALGLIAAGEHHRCTGAGERQRGFIAEAAGSAGDDGGLAVQGRNVCSAPAGHAYISRARSRLESRFESIAGISRTA
jgi:hypothetical protein